MVITFRYLVLVLLVFVIFSCTSRRDRDEYDGYLKVTKVVDGDTFWVDDGSEKGLKIRLIGVNTPETRHPQKQVEYFGKESSEYVKNLLKGKKVRLDFDVSLCVEGFPFLVQFKSRQFSFCDLLYN